MKVVVDLDLCEDNARCVKAAPEVFALDDQDGVNILLPEIPEALREKVLDAERKCPRCAIKIEG